MLKRIWFLWSCAVFLSRASVSHQPVSLKDWLVLRHVIIIGVKEYFA